MAAVLADEGFDDLKLEVAINPETAKGIVSSTQLVGWEEMSPVRQFPGRIKKSVIPIDFAYYRMGILTKVEAGVTVGIHQHAEPVFRFVIAGDLTINGIKHKSGDWVLVPSNTPYEVRTRNGYTILASYGMKCGAPPDSVISKE
jgi:hypothetical protein